MSMMVTSDKNKNSNHSYCSLFVLAFGCGGTSPQKHDKGKTAKETVCLLYSSHFESRSKQNNKEQHV
jgi:hypothetical protein